MVRPVDADRRLVLIEGRWHTGAGMRASEVVSLLIALDRPAEKTDLHAPALWGREIDDERYVVVSRNDEVVETR